MEQKSEETVFSFCSDELPVPGLGKEKSSLLGFEGLILSYRNVITICSLYRFRIHRFYFND